MSIGITGDYGKYGYASNVAVSPKYLQQCENDEQKAKELSDFMESIPQKEKEGYEQLSAHNAALGGKVTYYQQSWVVNDDGSVQSSVYSVTETEMTNAERMKKNMDELQEKQKEKREQSAIYEKSKESNDSGIYSINKKSAADRAAIAQQLKDAEEQQRNQLLRIVQKTLQGQVSAFGKATGDDIWKTLSGGDFKVDAATKAQAQKDISEDGYYGVKQTSQRLFDFASALAGDDVEKMKKMQKAMEKGFNLATGAWGRELPYICNETLKAANKLFDDYYKSKEEETAATTANSDALSSLLPRAVDKKE
ncbi:MAG: hypothetical protein E7301_09460 [Butyrivibrio sp.]|nr:hypothetical protein [Butyrivibrio sp.]